MFGKIKPNRLFSNLSIILRFLIFDWKLKYSLIKSQLVEYLSWKNQILEQLIIKNLYEFYNNQNINYIF